MKIRNEEWGNRNSDCRTFAFCLGTLTDEVKDDRITPSTEADGDDVKKLCNLQSEIIVNEFGTLNTDEVVVTNERLQHIQEHHPEDYSLFEEHGKRTVEDPDIIIQDIKHESTVFLVKRLENTNLNTIIRLSVANADPSEHKNSVMTFYRIRTSNLEKLMNKHKVLYKKSEK